MTTLYAGTLTTNSYVATADSSGSLILQTGVTPTNALTINSSQQIGIGTSSPTALIHANVTMPSITSYQTSLILQGQPATGSTGNTTAGNIPSPAEGTTLPEDFVVNTLQKLGISQ